MAKKRRPTFSATRDNAAHRPDDSQWVYRSDVAAPIAAAAVPAVPARATAPRRSRAVAPAAPAARSSAVVACAALLLFPVAAIAGLVVEPLAACFRRTR